MALNGAMPMALLGQKMSLVHSGRNLVAQSIVAELRLLEYFLAELMVEQGPWGQIESCRWLNLERKCLQSIQGATLWLNL